MSLFVCSFASGSTGNCILVASESTKILVDVGISTKKVEENLAELRLGTDNLSILVTHSHSDHIKDVPSLAAKYNLPVFAHRKTAPTLRAKLNGGGNLIPFSGGDFFVGDITVSPFVVSHDVHCLGYSFYHRGKKLTVVTDLGRTDEPLLEHICDSNAILMEANHDTELVNANKNYTPWLKRRILSDTGHLSNIDCAKAAFRLARNGATNIILGHLSRENNYPELAYSEVCTFLAKNGIKEGRDVCIEVAAPNQKTKLIEVV